MCELAHWCSIYLSIPHQRDFKCISVEANIALRAELAIACGYLRPRQPGANPHRTDPPPLQP